MDTDDIPPKEETVKCLTAKVTTSLSRKSKFSNDPSFRPIPRSTTPPKHSLNLDFQEPDATVATITGGNHRRPLTAAMQSTQTSIQL